MGKSRYEKYSDTARKMLVEAQNIVRAKNSDSCTMDEFITALITSDSSPILSVIEIPDEQMKAIKTKHSHDNTKIKHKNGKIKISDELRDIFDKAEKNALDIQRQSSVHFIHLLQAGWSDFEPLLKARFIDAGVSESITEDIVVKVAAKSNKESKLPKTLGQIGKELTAKDNFLPFFGRDREISILENTLLRNFKPNALLIGPAGVGKTAIVEEFARRILEGSLSPFLRNCRIIQVNAINFLAGTGLHGSYEERMKNVISELEEHKEFILFIDELHQILDSSNTKSPGEILKSSLLNGRVRCIGTTTISEYYTIIKHNTAFERRFNAIKIDEPSGEMLTNILKETSNHLSKVNKIQIPDNIIPYTVQIADSFLPHRVFPDKAIEILDMASACVLARHEDLIRKKDIRSVVARLSGIPLLEEKESMHEHLLDIKKHIKSRVLGQDHAIGSVISVIQMCKEKLDLRPERPDGVFLFLGPTGVGKTMLAKELALELTGSEKHLIRLDMSEFSEKDKISALIGSTYGYIGSDQMPVFLQELNKYPTGVLLLDEIEKAHPQIYNLFLQVFDEGVLTDAKGNKFSLSNITIIATSNAMHKEERGLGFSAETAHDYGKLSDASLKELEKTFPREFLNRFDEIIFFKPMSRDICRVIIERNILSLANKNLVKHHGVKLELDSNLTEYILENGYSPKLGARNLQRTFEQYVISPLVSEIRKFTQGPDAAKDPMILHAGYDKADNKVLFY